MIDIEWTEEAIKDLEKLDRPIAQRILKKINWLSANFDRVTPEPLRGELKGTFKFRIGDWRVVYTREESVLTIHFIGHRGEIYRLREN